MHDFTYSTCKLCKIPDILFVLTFFFSFCMLIDFLYWVVHSSVCFGNHFDVLQEWYYYILSQQTARFKISFRILKIWKTNEGTATRKKKKKKFIHKLLWVWMRAHIVSCSVVLHTEFYNGFTCLFLRMFQSCCQWWRKKKIIILVYPHRNMIYR